MTERSEHRFEASDRTTWTAQRFMYNGGYGGEPRQYTANAAVGSDSYGDQSHEIELTRADIDGLLDIIAKTENDWREDVH